MDPYNQNYPDSWEPGIYETGRTRPPKRHGGLLALLLAAVILLSGLTSILGFLNVRLFTELKLQDREEDALSFVNEATETILDAYDPSEVASSGTAQTDSFSLSPTPAAVPNVPQEGGLSLQEIYVKNIPSVVSISCTLSGGSSTGTGVILSQEGYLVTNAHVVENAQQIQVLLTDDRSFSATLVGADAVSDLAVLHIEAEDLTAAEFGDSSSLQVGDAVVAIGDPLGAEFRGTMTDGIISAIDRDVTVQGRTLSLIQTNAAMNSGNSGGPLINCYGQVIGINTVKIGAFVDSAGVEGLGFAIPSTTVREIAGQLMEQGYVSGRPSLGITGESVDPFYQMYYRWPAGLYITELEPDCDAAQKGIQAGDVLISIDDNRITSMEELNQLLYSYAAGDSVRLVIYRGGKQYSAQITLGEYQG